MYLKRGVVGVRSKKETRASQTADLPAAFDRPSSNPQGIQRDPD